MSGQRGGTMRHLIRSPRGAFALAVLAQPHILHEGEYARVAEIPVAVQRR